MTKLIKYLKPFTLWILVAVVLLYAQAMTDLALPDYLSDIVNVGISQSGVESPIPEVVSESTMDKLNLFLEEDVARTVLSAYTLLTPEDKSYDKHVDEKLYQESIYILQEDVKDLDIIKEDLSKAWFVYAGIQKAIMDAKGGDITLNGQVFPAGTDVFGVFESIPQADRIKIVNEVTSTWDTLFIEQTAIKMVQFEYEAIGVDVDHLQKDYITRTGLLMLGISLIGAACTIIVGFIAARVAARLALNLRRSLFVKVSSFSNNEYDHFSTSTLITRSTNDISQIQNLIVIVIRMIFYAPILGIGGIIRAFNKSTSMAWVIALAVIVLLGFIGIMLSITLPKFKMMQKLVDKINLVMRENLVGMMVIRAFNTQRFEEKRFDNANQDLTKTNLFIQRVMSVMFPVISLIMNGTTILIIWVGAHLIEQSSIQVGDMMAYIQYAMQIIFSFLMLSMTFIMLPRASVSAQRISEVLESEISIIDPLIPQDFEESKKGVVEFKNVSFRYANAEEDMLKNVSFTAEPGKITAIIGSTGSGKTTLVNLIPRFYDVTQGEVLVEGKDVRNVSQHDLRERIGYIPQKGALFSGTIESNLKYANEKASVVELENAASIAQAMDFINEKPEGFASEISEGGTNVSGGQKQRLSIARALVKKPQIYIFDDSFSALDYKTDTALRRALHEKTGDSTLIIVAQRISTIKNADQIIVLEDGKLVGIGTHSELMSSCETYQEIAFSQLSKEELA